MLQTPPLELQVVATHRWKTSLMRAMQLAVLMLAMLLPDRFGVPGAPALNIFGVPPPMTVLQISSHRARSSVGADNRRTNAIEGLLNYWKDVDEPIRPMLLETWVLVGRAVEIADPFHRLLIKGFARKCFAVPNAVLDDGWFEDMQAKLRAANEQWYLCHTFLEQSEKMFEDQENLENPDRSSHGNTDDQDVGDERDVESDEGEEEENSEIGRAKESSFFRLLTEQALEQWYKRHMPAAYGLFEGSDKISQPNETTCPLEVAVLPTPSRISQRSEL